MATYRAVVAVSSGEHSSGDWELSGKIEAVLLGGKATFATRLGGELVEIPLPLDDAGDELDVRERKLARRRASFVTLFCLRRARGGLRLCMPGEV